MMCDLTVATPRSVLSRVSAKEISRNSILISERTSLVIYGTASMETVKLEFKRPDRKTVTRSLLIGMISINFCCRAKSSALL
jgi:hypothetical protein